jgi:hypothetical protein
MKRIPFESNQTIERLSRHRPERQVAAGDDCVRRLALNLAQNCVEGGNVSMDVVEGGNTHDGGYFCR